MPLISLKKSLTDLDRVEEKLEASQALGRGVLETLGHRALEIDLSATRDLRAFLETSLRALDDADEPAAFHELRGGFERAWSDYHERSCCAHRQLKQRLDDTVRALQETLTGIDHGPTDGPEERLMRQVGALKELQALEDLAEIRRALAAATEQLIRCAEDLRRERTMMVTQLRDEIRTLQKNLDQAEKTASIDYVTGILNRREIERAITSSIQSRAPFALLYVWLRNFKPLERELPRTTTDQIAAAVASEVLRLLPAQTTLGRWSDDEFCAMVSAAKPAAMLLTRNLSARLNNHFPFPGDAAGRSVTLTARVGIIEAQSDETPERFFHRSDRLIKAIQGSA